MNWAPSYGSLRLSVQSAFMVATTATYPMASYIVPVEK